MEMQFPVILDGATGTELQKRGFTGDMSAEQWVLEHPESILEIQRKYVASGSNVLYAPTTTRCSAENSLRKHYDLVTVDSALFTF